ncbi:MAG TPA: hypothetical protein DCE71_05330 [Parachlamydiales bacterium]|nr:hypothetical protein [Parachlamydiales bacterium]
MQMLSSCSSHFSELLTPFSLISSKITETATSIKKRLDQTLISLNRNYGFTRQQWLDISQIALRALAPFVAALFIVLVFPYCAAQILFPPVIIGVIFLSAFYGLPDQKFSQEDFDINLEEIPINDHF